MLPARFGLIGRRLLFASVLATPAAWAQPDSDIQLPELRRELLERRERDQAIRDALIKSGAENPDPKIRDEMRAIDRDNTERVKEIVLAHGWPGPELVGADGTFAVWLFVQHSTPEFQKEMLPRVEKAYRDQKLPGSSYALLLDRVRVHEGKPQVYGSQGRWENGVLGLQPIEDEANVDQRRKEVGLGPLAEYLAGLRAMYNSKSPTASAASASGRETRGPAMPNSDFARLKELERRRTDAIAAANSATGEKDSKQRNDGALVSQQLSWARSVVGDYAGAFEAVRRPSQSSPVDLTEKARELISGFEPRDAIAGIVEAARDRQIVILNEAHHVARHRAFALLLARELRTLGFEYLACETFSSTVDIAAMQPRKYPLRRDGAYIRDRSSATSCARALPSVTLRSPMSIRVVARRAAARRSRSTNAKSARRTTWLTAF